MANYYLHTEPDTKGNYCLHIAGCSCLNNSNQFVLLGNFTKIEEVIAETKSSDYRISLCKECIDIHFSKTAIDNTPTIFVQLKNAIQKRLRLVIPLKNRKL